MKHPAKIQRVELVDYGDGYFCPFCGSKVLVCEDEDGTETSEMSPCEHLIFAATDNGFEYRSRIFDRIMNIEGVADDDTCDSYHELTDAVPLENSVKFAFYAPAPFLTGFYLGFSQVPLDPDER